MVIWITDNRPADEMVTTLEADGDALRRDNKRLQLEIRDLQLEIERLREELKWLNDNRKPSPAGAPGYDFAQRWDVFSRGHL